MGGRGTEAAPEGPIYIGGTSRSGKTLVRWILSSHPRIVVTRRTDMWTRFSGRFGELSEPANLDRCLRAMLQRRQIAELAVDVDRVRRELRVGPVTYGRLFAAIHQQVAERAGKPRWGDQTGSVERFADELLAQMPDARIVHLIRDPRDVVGAVFERQRRRVGGVGRAARVWRSSAAIARRNLERHAGRYEVLRYEDLVSSPEATIRRLCAFLGERYDPRMLGLEAGRRYDAARAASPDGTPITPSFVGHFRRSLAPADVATIQWVARREMAAFGYELDPVRLSTAERIRRAAAWPLGAADSGRSA